MISNENVINNKVVEIIKIYNFYFDHFFVQLCLNNSKFEFQNMRASNIFLGQLMISNEKVVNNKVVQPNVIYNSCISNFSIRQNGSIHCSQLGTSFILITYNYVRDVSICEQCLLPPC